MDDVKERLAEIIGGAGAECGLVMHGKQLAVIANAILEAFPELQGWRDIESAPRDGTPFQAWMTDGKEGRTLYNCWVQFARFNKAGKFEAWGDLCSWVSDLNPDWRSVAWRPLPTPPEEAK